MGEERLAELGEVCDGKSGVGFFGGLKGGFDADVELLIAALEPTTATGAKGSRLFDFAQAEKRTVKFASGVFAALWRRKLDMVYANDPGVHREEDTSSRYFLSVCP